VLLCAADTFRAAAIEQLEVWAARSGVEMIKTNMAAIRPPSSTTPSRRKARNIHDLYVDTAGRLHTKTGLMDELDKMRRTAARLIPGAPHEVLLVMDATTGQNGLQQARLFTESAGSPHRAHQARRHRQRRHRRGHRQGDESPVRFVGVGEKMLDLLEFRRRRLWIRCWSKMSSGKPLVGMRFFLFVFESVSIFFSL